MSDTPKSNAELVARADKLIAALNARNRYFPLDVLDLIFKMKQALTTAPEPILGGESMKEYRRGYQAALNDMRQQEQSDE